MILNNLTTTTISSPCKSLYNIKGLATCPNNKYIAVAQSNNLITFYNNKGMHIFYII